MPRSFHVVLMLVMVLFLLSACNHSSSRSASNTAGAGPSQLSAASEVFIQAVYEDSDAARVQGEKALDKLRKGDAASAADDLAAARTRMNAAAERCAAMQGCAVARIVKAQDALLEAQATALVGLGAASAEGFRAFPMYNSSQLLRRASLQPAPSGGRRSICAQSERPPRTS